MCIKCLLFSYPSFKDWIYIWERQGVEKKEREPLLHETLYSSRNLDKEWRQNWDHSRDLPESSHVVKIKVPEPITVILNTHPISHEPWDVL